MNTGETKTAKTMAQVLAEHRHNEGIELSGRIYTWCLCEGLDGWRAYGVSGPRAYAEHVEAALAAAGFGLVAEAQARAYDKGYGHGRHDGMYYRPFTGNPRPQKSRRNPYRKASNDDS